MDYDRAWSPYDHMRQYRDNDVAESWRLWTEVNEPRKTLHESTMEQDGVTVIVFNTKIVIVHANGTVQEFARAYSGLWNHEQGTSRAG